MDAQACTQTYINSCQLLSDPMGRGYSVCMYAPPWCVSCAHTLVCLHTHTLVIWLHLCHAQVYSNPHLDSINPTPEAFSTFINTTSKILTCFREIKREREQKRRENISQQDGQLAFYIEQWLKTSNASFREEKSLKLKSMG